MASIFIITNPMPTANKSAEVTTSKLIRVIRPSADAITVLGGNVTLEKDLSAVPTVSISYDKTASKIKKVLNYAKVQLSASWYILRNVKKTDKCIFWLADKMILPYVAAKLKKCEVNYFVYGNLTKEGVTGFSISLIRYMANHASYVCAESPSVIQDWDGMIDNSRTRTMHLYVDEIQYNPRAERENIVGIAARIAEVKHVKQCITAFHKIHRANPSWHLEIAGTGIQEAECKELIDSLHASDYIHMLGWVPHNEMSCITKRWKYYLLASDHEGIPNGLIEMMGQGIPAIVTPVGGVPDLVKDGVNGWLLKGTEAMEIANAIEVAIESDQYDAMARCAYDTIATEFSLQNAQIRAKSCLN